MNFSELVAELTEATTTTTITLTGATPGFRTFAQGFTVGMTEIPVSVSDSAGNFESGLYTLTSSNVLTRTAIYKSSNNNAAVAFPAGTKSVVHGLSAGLASDIGFLSKGVTLGALPAAAALSGSNLIAISQDGGATEVRTTLTALAAAIAILNGGGGATVPGAPTIGTASAGNGTASVAFTAPASNGGSAITGYTVTVSPGGATFTGASSPIAVTGLTNGSAYTFTVTATNAIGTSAASSASNSVTPSAGATVPGAPMIGTATAGDASASVTFTAPASNGGSAITSYTVTSSPGGFTGTGAASPINVTGLANGTAYTFTVTATNAIGTGAASAASNSVTPAAMVAYTITKVGTGNINTTMDGGAANASTQQPSTGTATLRGFLWGKTGGIQYWTFSPNPASARGGWFPKGYTPTSADFITTAQHVAGGASVNGLAPLTAVSTNFNAGNIYLWITIGSGTSEWCFWLMGLDGVPQCMNPSGLTVSNA